ncbi:hypothetical protein IAU60_003611 [Kwoniella sp. DSM 27419]
MTEYWVSKKQYYCKYCSIYIRDDAPSRKQHETGLKHIGNVERYIRDLYRGGAQAKREKAQEAAEMARIEALAAAAHAKDTHTRAPSSRPSVLQAIASSSAAAAAARRPIRDKPKDKFANYSTAEQLGLVNPDEEESSYEIEQQLGGKVGEAGQWEVVEAEPGAAYTPAEGSKRTRDQRDDDEAEGEGWKFDHKGKKAVRDPYEDDWDPASLKLKLKSKEKRVFEDKNKVKEEDGALKRELWSGKIELNPMMTEKRDANSLVYRDGGWVKQEDGTSAAGTVKSDQTGEEDTKPDLTTEGEVDGDGSAQADAPDTKPTVAAEAAGGSSMFKKRRPPPSSRKK